MKKKSKTYLRKPNGTIVRLTVAQYPVTNAFLLSHSKEITDRIEIMGTKFKPDTIDVPEPFNSQIRKELKIFRNPWGRKRKPVDEISGQYIEVSMDSSMAILVNLRL